MQTIVPYIGEKEWDSQQSFLHPPLVLVIGRSLVGMFCVYVCEHLGVSIHRIG